MKLPQATKQAETEGAAGESETARTRKTVSKRFFLDSAGNEVEKIEEATGGRYQLLDPAGNHNFDQQFGKAGEFVTMCAIFGFQTKVGNVANTVLNDKDEPGTPADAKAAIDEFIARASDSTDPVWADRTGGVGAKVDRDALAGAIIEVAQASGKITADEANDKYAVVRQKLEDDPAYLRKSRQVPDVARAYAIRVGKNTSTINDLL